MKKSSHAQNRNLTKDGFLTILTFLTILCTFSEVEVSGQGIPPQTKAPAGIERVASVEGITEYSLPNGLRVLLFPDQTKQTTTVNITYLVGSRHENYGETGMAHLLEHLVFKGTPKHPNIPAELTTRGASPNGTTSYDRTNYYETFTASDTNLEWALDLEADRMINSYIAKKDLDLEFSVVRNELETGENSPFRVLWQRVMATAYEWHNYGKSTVGARSDVENVPIDRLQAFYKKYYQPDNAVLLVAGKFDEAKTLEIIKKYFGAIPRPDRVLPPNYTVESVQDGERTVTVRRAGDTQMLMSGYHVPPGSHPDAAAIAVLAGVLLSEPSGRLYKSLVETKKATSVFNLNLQTKEPGYLLFVSELRKEQSLDDARGVMADTVENFTRKPPTKEEVERTKTEMLKDIELALNDPNRVGLEMSKWIAQGDWRLYFLTRDRLQKIAPEDVRRVAEKYLKPTNRTVGMFVPTDKPDRAAVPSVKDAEIAAMVKDYKGDAAVIAQGEEFIPTQANIEARTKRLEIGGLKVALLPKENRGDGVSFNLLLHFGDEKSLTNQGYAGSFAGQMLMRGTTGRTRQQIQDELARLKAQGFVGGSDFGTAYGSFETTRQNLPEVLKLVAEMLREPSFPESEFEKLKQETLANLEGGKSAPFIVAFDELNRYFYRYPKGDARYARTIDEQIADTKSLTLDQVKTFHKNFYGASNGELAIVGDFDPEEITSLIKELFGKWKSPKPFRRIAYRHFDFPATNKSLETPDKANAYFVARLNIRMRDDDPDYPAMVIGNHLFGGGSLNSRLATRIRQKEGLSYEVSSSFTADALDETGTFTARASFAPQNAAKLEAAFFDELKRVVTDGFTAEEIEAAKSGWLKARQLARAQDGALATGLRNNLFLGRTFFVSESLEKKVQALTPEQVNRTMRKYIALDKISVFKAGDFAKTKR